MDYLFSLGHQRIGYVGECHNETRYQGYLESFRKHNLTVEPAYVIETKQTEIGGFEVMQKLMQEKNRPTAIYCANDITAIGMLKCLNQFHNRYYRSSIISSDDIEEAENSKPMLTTVRLPKNEMGKFAMQLLVDRLKNGHSSVVRMELKGKLSQVMNTISLFEQFHVEYNILTVVTNETAQKASALYHFYKRNKMAYIQLIPCMDEINRKDEVSRNSQAVKPEQYGKFLNEMFDLWYEDFMHGEDMDIRMFSNLAQLSAGFPAEECGMNGNCNLHFAVADADAGGKPGKKGSLILIIYVRRMKSFLHIVVNGFISWGK